METVRFQHELGGAVVGKLLQSPSVPLVVAYRVVVVHAGPHVDLALPAYTGRSTARAGFHHAARLFHGGVFPKYLTGLGRRAAHPPIAGPAVDNEVPVVVEER